MLEARLRRDAGMTSHICPAAGIIGSLNRWLKGQVCIAARRCALARGARGSIVREIPEEQESRHDRDAARRRQGPERGSAGAADLRDAGGLRPWPGAGRNPRAGARARQAPDARCHRHRLCLRPLRFRPQGHDRHCRPRRGGQRARDRPAARLPPRDAALINGILVHGLDFDDTHSRRHHPCHRQPVADGDGDRLHARRVRRRPADRLHRRHRSRPSGSPPSAAARSISWASIRPA